MIKQRRDNLKLFNSLFLDSKTFKVFKSAHYDSSFSFPLILKKDHQSIKKIFIALRNNNIQFRSITGGNFTKHIYLKHFDYVIPENLKNANRYHNYGFVGNSSIDLSDKIKILHRTLKNF